MSVFLDEFRHCVENYHRLASSRELPRPRCLRMPAGAVLDALCPRRVRRPPRDATA